MKKLLTFLVVLCGLLSASVVSKAQDTPSQNFLYAWATPTTTGQLGNYLILSVNRAAPINDYSIDWSLSGTAPAACTFRVEGSFDNVNWFGLDTTSPASTSCTTSNMESIAFKPSLYLRINIVTWTTGDTTTRVIFHFTGSQS